MAPLRSQDYFLGADLRGAHLEIAEVRMLGIWLKMGRKGQGIPPMERAWGRESVQ